MKSKTIVERRLDFLQIDESTATTLREMRTLFEGAIDDLLDKFYSHILQQPELKSLFSDDESVERARKAQRHHWLETLFSMNPGRSQFDRAESIGQAHVRIGLTPGRYMGGYCFMLNQFVELVSERYQDDPVKFCGAIQALNKIIFLDMDFVIDSYLYTKDKVMRELLHRATQFADDVKQVQLELASTAQDLEATTESFVLKTKGLQEQVDQVRDILEKASSEIDTKPGERPAGRRAEMPGEQALIRISALLDELHKEDGNAQDVLQCSTKLSDQVGKLDSRLVQLETEDKLYLHPRPRGKFMTRIKAFVEDHLPGH